MGLQIQSNSGQVHEHNQGHDIRAHPRGHLATNKLLQRPRTSWSCANPSSTRHLSIPQPCIQDIFPLP